MYVFFKISREIKNFAFTIMGFIFIIYKPNSFKTHYLLNGLFRAGTSFVFVLRTIHEQYKTHESFQSSTI